MKYLLLIAISLSAFASDRILINASMHKLKINEGVRHTVYKDIYGYRTIGIGHRVTSNESFGVLTDAEVKELFVKDVKRQLRRCRRKFPKFNTYPICVRVAILDGFFRGCLAGSPKAIALIKNGEWIKASHEYVDNAEYRKSKKDNNGVYKRMDRNALMYLRYGEKLGEQS